MTANSAPRSSAWLSWPRIAASSTQAAQDLDKEFAVAQKKNDAAAMAADLQAKGNILAQTPNLDQAKQHSTVLYS